MHENGRLPSFQAYLFDLDGTIYQGDELLPEAQATIHSLRQFGKGVMFITNESARTREQTAQKLTRMGIPTEAAHVFTPTQALIDMLHQHCSTQRIYLIGEEPLRRDLVQAGFQPVEDAESVSAVIVSNDYDFHYRKLKLAHQAIRRGALFFATNADRLIIHANGEEDPDALPLISAVQASTRKDLDGMAGKPSPAMAFSALRLLGLPPEDCLLVGDNLETDILMGSRCGMKTALVLTGASCRRHLAQAPASPDYILETLESLQSDTERELPNQGVVHPNS